ncbi:hypothetical protein EJ04DRAFT_583692 [Polyplosphaeria fusca]|uniref:Uncharacterized protein n=1 Tax=Polyplosphaeria fusca TaxID=682080 RepID=A0A9P4UYG5_9PLEO|nr:hypothetical protein EJ04DRAFT_583692 [Polyplosphaeria fusca]
MVHVMRYVVQNNLREGQHHDAPSSHRLLIYVSMSLCSSPRSPPNDGSAPYTAQPYSKELLEWYQLHFVTIPLANALRHGTAPPKYTTRDGSHRPRLSPTPSLLGDNASSLRHRSPSLSPRLYSQASPDFEQKHQSRPSLRSPRCRPLNRRNTTILHSMVTRVGSRHGKGRQIFWELDQAGLKKRRVRR